MMNKGESYILLFEWGLTCNFGVNMPTDPPSVTGVLVEAVKTGSFCFWLFGLRIICNDDGAFAHKIIMTVHLLKLPPVHYCQERAGR
jgi:hypothetical protein